MNWLDRYIKLNPDKIDTPHSMEEYKQIINRYKICLHEDLIKLNERI